MDRRATAPRLREKMSTMKPNKAAPASDAGAVAADSGSVLRPPNRDDLITKLNSMNPGDDVAKTTAIDLSGILEVAPN